jgi:4-amino-4-deoxy-L-arabinose transferase-like glycosyltransferase
LSTPTIFLPAQATPRVSNALALGLLLSLCALLFFHRLGDRELNSSHEARAAQNAQTILDTGDWGLPRLFDRRPELQKPPLYYWLVAALAWLAGGRVDAWAVRLPAALSALGTVLLVYLLAAARGRPRAGLIAAVILATSLHFTWMARVGRIDMPLTFTVSLALAGFSLGRCRQREGRRAWPFFALMYGAVSVGLLLKGPIAAVLPAVVGCAQLLSERARPNLALAHRLGLWWGVPLTLAAALPWYLWADARTDGEFFRVFFWHHNLDRGFGAEGGLAAHPWWFYGPRLFADLMPWSVLLPVAAWWLWRRGRADAEARFGAAWLLAVFALLSCMRFKRADYLLPAYPGAALLLGCAVEGWLREAQAARKLVAGFGVAVAGCVVGWLVYLEVLAPDKGWPDRSFAEAVRRHTPGPVLFFRVESHAVAFHVGRPLHTLLEWENLDIRAGRPRRAYIITDARGAADWPRHLRAGRLVEVLRRNDLTGHDRTLVLLRTEPLPATGEAPSPSGSLAQWVALVRQRLD